MAKYLSNVADLKSYIFRKLGSQIHTVEVTDEQWDDIIENSSRFFYDYSDWGSYKQFIVIEPNGQMEVELADSVVAISDCYGIDDAPNVANMAYPSSSIYYLLSVNGGGDQIQMSAYVVMRQYLNTFKDLFREPIIFDFNTESKRLRFGRSDYNKVAFRVVTTEDIDEIVNNYLFKLVVEMNTLRQWADNINIKYDTSSASIMGNGLKLNPDRMNQKADSIQERIDKGIDEDEWGSLIPIKRLFS